MEAAHGSQVGASSSNSNKENCCIGDHGGGGGGLHRFRGESEIDDDDDIASDKKQDDAGAVSYDGVPPRQGFDSATAFTFSDDDLELMLQEQLFRTCRKRRGTMVDDDLGATVGGGTSNEAPADPSASTASAETAAEAASGSNNNSATGQGRNYKPEEECPPPRVADGTVFIVGGSNVADVTTSQRSSRSGDVVESARQTSGGNQGDADAANYERDHRKNVVATMSDDDRDLIVEMLQEHLFRTCRKRRKTMVVDDDLGAAVVGRASNDAPADPSASTASAETASTSSIRDDDEVVNDVTANSKNQGGVIYDGDPRQVAVSSTSDDDNEFRFVRCGHCGSRRVHPPAAHPLGVEAEADEEGHGGEAGRPDDDSAVPSKPKSKRMRFDADEGAQNGAEKSRPRLGNHVPVSTEEEEEKEEDTKAKLLALKTEFDAYVAHAELEKDLAAAKSAKEVKDLTDRIAVLERAHNDSKK